MNDIKKRVMRRVYFIYFLRQITHPLFLKLVAVALLLGKITSYVSIGNVISNLPTQQGFAAGLGFFESAFTQTEVATQVLALTIGALSLWLLRDMYARNIGSEQRFSHS